jgi:hypothetical protein
VNRPPRPPLFGRDTPQASPSEVGVFVPVEEVFPGTEANERTLIEVLSTLSRDDTLFHAARINTLISGPGDYDIKPRQQAALSWLCTTEQIDRINDFARRHKTSGVPAVFFRGQLLELMRWAARYCKNLPGDGTTFDDPAFRERLVKAALIAGTLWGARTFRDKLSADGDIAELRRRALGAMRKGVEEGNLAPHIGVAIGRGLKLFTDYLPRHYPDFAGAFLTATGLTLQQYLGCATSLSIYTVQHRQEGPMFVTQTIAAATTYRDIFPKFFALESQTPEELATTFWSNFDTTGYRTLRERPIMVAADGRGMILDPTFFIERVSIGALFHVAKGKGKAESLKVFTAFGDAFEEYANDILKRMYPHRPGLVDRVACGLEGSDGHGKAFQIDAALIDVPQAVVFEMKAAFLREEAIVDDRPASLIKEIRSKYGAASEKGERGKGVAQLARSIGAIVRGEWVAANGEFADTAIIYPVLVVHDTRLDAPALGHFLENDFRSLLATVPPGKRVAPLTVMTIQDLENLERSVESFSFVKLLEDYSRECPDRMRSLHNYLAFSDYAKKIMPSGFLIDASIGILDLLQKELFPAPPSEPSDRKSA